MVGKPFKYLIPERQGRMNMGTGISVCSRKQYLALLDASLTRFHQLYPHAQLKDMTLGAYTVRELWKEIRAEMRTELSHVPGNKITMHNPKTDDLNESPFAAWAAPYRVLRKSDTITATQGVFLRHGFSMPRVSLGTEFWFKEELNGQSWAKISMLSDVGIATPGTIEFTL